MADVLSDNFSFFAGTPDMPKQKQHKKQDDNKPVNQRSQQDWVDEDAVAHRGIDD